MKRTIVDSKCEELGVEGDTLECRVYLLGAGKALHNDNQITFLLGGNTMEATGTFVWFSSSEGNTGLSLLTAGECEG